MMARKFLISFFATILVTEGLVQIIVVLAVIIVMLFLQAKYWAWYHPITNRLDTFLLSVEVAILITSFALYEKVRYNVLKIV